MYPLVSVVIPAYNAERFLPSTLESALAQTYPNFEVIVVDDGSVDETANIVEYFSRKDSRISLIKKENGGVSSARNLGIRKASGQYVAFLDADDIWSCNKIAEQIAALHDDGIETCVAAFSLYRLINANDEVLDSSYCWGGRDFSLSQHLVLRPVGNGSSLIVRRDVALEVGGYDVDYVRLGAGGCEDLDFELKVAALHPIRCVPRHHVGYRVYPGNMSSERVRMARAMEMTIAKNLDRNPGVSAYCRRMAWTSAYRYSTGRLMRLGYAKDFLHFMMRFMVVNPVDACRHLGESVAEKLKRSAQRFQRQKARSALTPFVETDPSVLGRPPNDISVNMIYDRLAAERGTATSGILPPHALASPASSV